MIAFTGYQGILGYRTAPSYSSSPTYEEDKQAAAAVAQCLRDNGWELASHSWGHRDLASSICISQVGFPSSPITIRVANPSPVMYL